MQLDNWPAVRSGFADDEGLPFPSDLLPLKKLVGLLLGREEQISSNFCGADDRLVPVLRDRERAGQVFDPKV